MDAIATARESRFLQSLLRSKESAILLALAIMVIVIALVAPRAFLSGMNIYQVSRQVSFVAIVALGELFVILTGGIDLSVGSVMGWSGMAAAWAMTLGVPWGLAF